MSSHPLIAELLINPETLTRLAIEKGLFTKGEFLTMVKAVQKAGSTDPAAVQKAIIGVETPNLTGGTAKMLPNHHITKPVLIGEIQANGQFYVVWKDPKGLVRAQPWSPFIAGNEKKPDTPV